MLAQRYVGNPVRMKTCELHSFREVLLYGLGFESFWLIVLQDLEGSDMALDDKAHIAETACSMTGVSLLWLNSVRTLSLVCHWRRCWIFNADGI